MKNYEQNELSVNINSDQVVSQNLIGLPVTLTTAISPSDAGSITPSGGSYPWGRSVTLIATPGSGWQFSSWSGDIGGNQNSITINMDGNKTVTANFMRPQVSLTINISPSGAGSITPSGGIYNWGTSITLTATPSSGWKFSSWGGDFSGSQNPITININGDKIITAVFFQPAELPHMFYGSASIDGVNAAAGTQVTVQIDGKDVASSTYNGTRYSLTVSAPIGQSFKDKTITFMVGTATVSQIAKHTPGDVTVLNLTATTVPPGPPAIMLSPSTGVVTTVYGSQFTSNSRVSIMSESKYLASALTDGIGHFSVVVVAPDQTKPGAITISAMDSGGKVASAVFTVPDLRSPAKAP